VIPGTYTIASLGRESSPGESGADPVSGSVSSVSDDALKDSLSG